MGKQGTDVIATDTAARLDAPSGNRWFTLEQAAHYLQVSPSTVRSWVRQNKLTAARLADKRVLRFSKESLDALLVPVQKP